MKILGPRPSKLLLQWRGGKNTDKVLLHVNVWKTRKHSSRTHTTRLLTVRGGAIFWQPGGCHSLHGGWEGVCCPLPSLGVVSSVILICTAFEVLERDYFENIHVDTNYWSTNKGTEIVTRCRSRQNRLSHPELNLEQNLICTGRMSLDF